MLSPRGHISTNSSSNLQSLSTSSLLSHNIESNQNGFENWSSSASSSSSSSKKHVESLNGFDDGALLRVGHLADVKELFLIGPLVDDLCKYLYHDVVEVDFLLYEIVHIFEEDVLLDLQIGDFGDNLLDVGHGV